MINREFPSNSKSPRAESEPKRVEQVTTSEVISQKKTLGRRFRETFIAGDSKSILNYVILDVLVPQAKDMIVEAFHQGLERMIYGESRPSRSRPGIRSGSTPGHINYANRYTSRGNNPIGRADREDHSGPTASVRSHNFDDILLATRVEAETVLDRMYDLLRDYEMASVADLYSLIGWSSSHVDQKWGWTDLKGATPMRTRNGYLLNLPTPLPLD
jgi:hypothetical protein